jgi:hypothetical protein
MAVQKQWLFRLANNLPQMRLLIRKGITRGDVRRDDHQMTPNGVSVPLVM